MPFEFPAFSDITYRVWRLRRLIGVTTLLPLVIFALTGLFGFNALAGSTGGLALIGLVILSIIAAHTSIFPNAYEETLSISLVLAALALFLPAFGGSIFGWVIFIVFAIWLFMSGQTRISMWQMATKPHKPIIKAKVRTPAKIEAARSWFPLRPEMERGQYRCGPADADGVFPVWYDMPTVDVFEGINLPEQPEYATAEEYCAALGIEPADPEYDEIVAEWGAEEEPDAGESHASFWARIDEDSPECQRTEVLQRDGANSWTVETIVEHHFKPLKNGCIVTEIETPTAFPWGSSLTMWLNDFQKDGLVYLSDLLAEKDSKALKVTHRWSLLMLIGRWFMARQVNRMTEA